MTRLWAGINEPEIFRPQGTLERNTSNVIKVLYLGKNLIILDM